jgi:FKBP-type peptidyl-prolyl cis-trans isomerase
MTLSHLRPVVLLSCIVAVVAAIALTADAWPQTPAQQAAPAAPIVRPIPAPADVAAPPADAVKTKTGLATKVITPGTGTEHPKADDMVTVHYTGWSTKGVMFDSSYTRGKPSTFGVNRVIVGWGETVQLMVAGEKRRAWIPEELAYKGRADRPQGMLVFDIELISFTPNPASAPADVAAAPADAQKTRSGLAYKVLTPGAGSVHPRRNGTVTVHYTGWTTDGKMFDSSVTRGQPTSFPLDQVIPGWTEGVQLMVEGEKTRFWIPEKLAYDGQEGKPKGMLVFDVELITIQK